MVPASDVLAQAEMNRQRRSRPVRHKSNDQSAPRLIKRVNVRDTVIMAVVAAGFIGAFWFALSRPVGPTTSPAVDPATQPVENQRREPDRGGLASEESDFFCDEPSVTDGDTIRCGALRVRLASIDAPEMPGHCRRGRTCVDGDPYASKAHLQRLVDGGRVSCRQTDTDRYGRIVALCEASGQDLSCAQVQAGHAVVRYGDLTCS